VSSRAKDAVKEDLPFPVLEEMTLPQVPRKLLRTRRDLSELPVVRPGSVLVFRTGTRYVAFGEARHLTGAEDTVVDASAVSLVDLRTRVFTVYLPLPSGSAADDFTIKVSFKARVTDAERAAQEGPIKVTSYLTSYLQQDPRLAKLGSEHSVEEISEVRELVACRIESYHEYHPIDLPGLRVEFDSVSVLTPRELRSHKQHLRDEGWRQELRRLQDRGEDEQIDRIRKHVDGGSAALTVLGLARGETGTAEAISNARDDERRTEDNARDDERRMQDKIEEALRIIQRDGGLDFVDIDATELVHAYLEKLTGQSVPRASRVSLAGRGGDQRDAIAAGSDDEDAEQPDEAYFDE
jgi:hypothetical protein